MTFVLVVALVIVFFVLRARIAALQEQIESLNSKVDDLRKARYFAEKQRPELKTPQPQLPHIQETVASISATDLSTAPVGAAVPPPPAVPVNNQDSKSPDIAFLTDTVATATDFPKMPLPSAAEELDVESSLSEKLGTTGFVWIGAIALALAGIFFVKYWVDRGYIGPTVRIALAIAFGAGLLVAGEWMRSRSERISQALSASGVADLYAAFLASHHLYHLIPASVTFAFLALTTAVAVLLSLKQGQMVAVLGLLGGFLTPVWVQTSDPRPALLFSYLMLLQIALLLVTRKKQWVALALVTLGASMLWVLIWLMQLYQPPHSFILSIFLMATVGLFSGLSIKQDAWDQIEVVRAVNYGAFLVSTGLMAVLTHKTSYATHEWIYVGILSAASFTLARWKKEYITLAFATFCFVCMLFVVWPFSKQFSEPRYELTLLIALLLYTAAGYAVLWSTQKAIWAAFSVAAAVVLLMIGLSFIPNAPHVRWSVVSTLLAAACLVGMIPFYRMGDALEQRAPIVAAFAVGVTMLLNFGVPLELDRKWLTVPFALQSAALVTMHRRLRIAVLPQLALILAFIVSFLLLFGIGIRPVWYWILYSYGIAGVSFFTAAKFCVESRASRIFQWLGTFALFAMLILLPGQLHHPGALLPQMSWLENGTIATVALGYGLLLLKTGVSFNLDVLKKSAVIVACTGAIVIVYSGCIVQNPLWNHIDVGQRKLANSILFVYAIPAILSLLFSRKSRHFGAIVPEIFKLVSMLLFFCFLNLEIRQYFHGAYLYPAATTSLENYAYSVAWIVVGVTAGVFTAISQSGFWRHYSVAMLSLAVFKVFLFDVAHLTDLHRVLSFLGLGMSLLLIAYVYQKVLKR